MYEFIDKTWNPIKGTCIHDCKYCYMKKITSSRFIEAHVTIEPIMDFDLDEFVELIEKCNPSQVNIGADSKNNNLPEPTKD